MEFDESLLRKHIKALSDQELLRMLSEDPTQYRPEAVLLAKEECSYRRLSLDSMGGKDGSYFHNQEDMSVMPNILSIIKSVDSAIITIAVFLIFACCFPYLLLFFTSDPFTSGPSPSVAIGFAVLSYLIIGSLSRAWNRNLISLCVGMVIGIFAYLVIRFEVFAIEFMFEHLVGLFNYNSLFPLLAICFASAVAGWLIINLIVKRYHLTAAMGKKIIAVALIAFIAVFSGRLCWLMTRPVIPKAWLVRRVNLVEVEKPDWITRSDEFGQKWRALKEQMKPGDELWFYQRPRCVFCDEAGYALVRKGKPIAKLVTLVS